MARRCWCSTLLDRLRGDPLLRQAPLAVRAVWLELMAIMAAAPEPGVLRFAVSVAGSVSASVPRVVARLVSCEETEAETALAWLLANGLITQETDASLLAPELVAADRRAQQARENGRKGGRPRGDGTPAQRRLPLVSVHQGGDAKTQETETRTEPGTDMPREPRSPPLTTDSPTSVSQSREEGWVSTGWEVIEAAGLDTSKGRWDMLPVKAWQNEGASAALILDAVRLVAARPGYRPHVVKTLAYFNGAVREAIAAAKAPVQESDWFDRDAWQVACERWREGGGAGEVPLREHFRMQHVA